MLHQIVKHIFIIANFKKRAKMTYTEQIAERILSCNPTDTLGLSLIDYARLVSGDLMLPPKNLKI